MSRMIWLIALRSASLRSSFSFFPYTTTIVSIRSHHDPDLAAVVDAWPELPEAIRAGILAMVKAASGQNAGG